MFRCRGEIDRLQFVEQERIGCRTKFTVSVGIAAGERKARDRRNHDVGLYAFKLADAARVHRLDGIAASIEVDIQEVDLLVFVAGGISSQVQPDMAVEQFTLEPDFGRLDLLRIISPIGE